jgi:methionyl-tRNA formyltransferase
VRVAFLGNDPWSVAPLRALAVAEDVEVVLVVTNPPRPAGRGSRLSPTAVSDAARELDLPLLEIERVRDGEGFDALDGLEPDALVVVAYGEILTPGILDIPRLGAINVHFSLLPRWRGAAPVQHAILAGDEVTGITVMLMDEGMDTGPILLQAAEPIDPSDDAGSLGTRLAAMGGRLMVDTLDRVAAGTLQERPQDEGAATFAPRIRPQDEEIDWTRPAEEVVRRVRGLAPTPGARTRARGQVLKVLGASVHDLRSEGSLPPGTVRAEPAGVLVSTGDGWVSLDVVLPAGRRPMPGVDFVRGYRPEPGERLGSG